MSGAKKIKNIKFLIIALAVAVVFVVGELVIYNLFFASRDIGVRIEEESDGFYRVGSERAKKATKVNKNDVVLDEYKTDIIIEESGVYTLRGKFAHSVFVGGDVEVTLNLNGVDITSDQTAAIANIGAGKMTILTNKGTVNHLEDSGDDEYDGCIYSQGEVELAGEGVLRIEALQEQGGGIVTRNAGIVFAGGEYRIDSWNDGIRTEGAESGEIEIKEGNIQVIAKGDGIDAGAKVFIDGGDLYLMSATEAGKVPIGTKEGYFINGGTVIALGTDTMESPQGAEQGYYMSKLERGYEAGETISLIKSEGGNEIMRVTLGEDCNVILFSNKKMNNGVGYRIVEIAK